MVVWHDASDEVGIGGVEGGQQLVKLRPERRGDGLENLGAGVLSLLLVLNHLLRLAGMISEEIDNQRVLALLHLINLGSSKLEKQYRCEKLKARTTVSLH